MTRMTAYWSTFLEVRATPSFTLSLFFITAHHHASTGWPHRAAHDLSQAGASSTKKPGQQCHRQAQQLAGACRQIFMSLSFSPRSLFLSPTRPAASLSFRPGAPLRDCVYHGLRPGGTFFSTFPRGTWPHPRMLAPPGCAPPAI